MNMTTSTKVAIGVGVTALAVIGYGAMVASLMYRGVVKGEAYRKSPETETPVQETTVVDDIEVPHVVARHFENGFDNPLTFTDWSLNNNLSPGEYETSPLQPNALWCCEGKLEDHPYGESLAVIGETTYAHGQTWYV